MAGRRKRPVRMTREDLNRAFLKFMSTHYRPSGGEEAYDFNIKIQKIHIDPLVRKLRTEQEIEAAVSSEMNIRLLSFVDSLQDMYSWIDKWHQTGRSGGWMTLISDEPVLTDNWEVPLPAHHDKGPQDWLPNAAVKPAMDRLKDLESIHEMLRKGIAVLKRDLEGLQWWGITPKDWTPPEKRRPSMQGPFDFLKFRKEPERKDVIPIVPASDPRGLIVQGNDPFEILAPVPQSGALVRASAPSAFDLIAAPAPAPSVPRIERPPAADVAPRFNLFEAPAVPARPPRDVRRRISWRLPSAEELIARFNPSMLAQIFSEARAVRHSPAFRRELRQNGLAGVGMGVLAGGDEFGELADVFGIPYEVLDTYEDRGVVRDAIWNEVFFPIFETMSEAFEIAKPADLPGWFSVEYNDSPGAWYISYWEAE